MHRLALVWALAIGCSLNVGGLSKAKAGFDGALIEQSIQLPVNQTIDLRVPLANGEQIADTYSFFGLAQYLAQVQFYVLDDHELVHTSPETSVQLDGQQRLAAVGRFQVLLIQPKGDVVHVLDRHSLRVATSGAVDHVDAVTMPKSELRAVDPRYAQLSYAHLWKPLALMARLVEATLVNIAQITGLTWGFVLVIFAIFVKFALWPLSRWSNRMQSRVAYYQSILHPKIAAIKQEHKGEEAHNRIMAAHRALGVTPLFTLKPMLALLIQIPVLIAIFNALGEMPQFAGSSFLWVDDLAYPDAIGVLPFSIPWIGNTVNLMPILMALVAIVGAVLYREANLVADAARRKRRQLVLMGAVFLLLFYPFPAAMVLYWLMSNILQLIGMIIGHLVRRQCRSVEPFACR